MSRHDWRDRAACAGRSPSLDPSLPGLSGHERARVAAAYCHGCPVKAECARDALEHGDRLVVRAGVFITVNKNNSVNTQTRRTLEAVAGG